MSEGYRPSIFDWKEPVTSPTNQAILEMQQKNNDVLSEIRGTLAKTTEQLELVVDRLERIAILLTK